ncbi:hypothetical protein [Streptococcus pseudoporcinus]|nr:hypothetical protein [Streptococcus pseudoporcinus]
MENQVFSILKGPRITDHDSYEAVSHDLEGNIIERTIWCDLIS